MIEHFAGQTPEEQHKAMQRAFYNVFSTEEGTAVLNVILTDLHYFTPTKTEGDVALSNYAKILLNDRLGIDNTVIQTDLLIKSKQVKGE